MPAFAGMTPLFYRKANVREERLYEKASQTLD